MIYTPLCDAARDKYSAMVTPLITQGREACWQVLCGARAHTVPRLTL